MDNTQSSMQETVQKRAGGVPILFTNEAVVIAITPSLTCFQREGVVGTKIPAGRDNSGHEGFARMLLTAVKTLDWNGVTGGKAMLQLPEEANELCLSGVGKRTERPGDYGPVLYRGRVRQFLRRNRMPGEPVVSVKALVMTKAAYLEDRDVKTTPGEAERIANMGATHVLIAVLTDTKVSTGLFDPDAMMEEDRFVSNLAGGNRNFDNMDGERIRLLSRGCVAYNDEYAHIADVAD